MEKEDIVWGVIILLVFVAGVGLGNHIAGGDRSQAIAECEQNLPRSQKCYAVIIAEPDTGEAKDG